MTAHQLLMRMLLTILVFGACLGVATSAAAADPTKTPAVGPLPQATPTAGSALALDGVRRSADNRWEIPLQVLGYREAFRLTGQSAQSQLLIPVPDGLKPLELRFDTRISRDVLKGYLEIRDGEIVISSHSIAPPAVDLIIPLVDAEVRERHLDLTFLSRLRAEEGVCDLSSAGAWLNFQNATLIMTGAPRPPTSVGAFWPAALTRLTLYVPSDPTPAEADAVLQLTAGAAWRYAGQRPTIDVKGLPSRGGLPMFPAGIVDSFYERTIIVTESGADGAALVASDTEWPMLHLTGSASSLKRHAQLMIDRLAPLAAAPRVTVANLTQPEQLKGERLTLDTLGFLSPQVTGAGRMDIPFTVGQADLGGPVNALSVRLVGRYTPPQNGASATLSVLLNSALIHAIPLGKDGVFDVYVPAPKEILGRDNTLTARFDYTPQGDCHNIHPFTAQIVGNSYFQVEWGQTLPAGFTRFPQVLRPTFQVAFDKVTLTGLQSVVPIMSLLQRPSKSLLRPQVVTWEVATTSKQPAMLIASDANGASRLNPPLLPGSMRAIDADGRERLRIEADARMATLEAFEQEGRDLLLLTQRGDDTALLSQLVKAILAEPLGWYSLRGDVLIKTPDDPHVDLRLRNGPLRTESLDPSAAIWWDRLQPFLFVSVFIAGLLFMAWIYPKVVRRSPRG